MNATRTDTVDALSRTARRYGWKATIGSLDYYSLKFTRTEPGDRYSQVLVRVTGPDRVVEAQIEVNGMRRQLILPSVREVEDVLASPSTAG